jgi:calcineurin-like phosphoesterase family protein
MPNVFITADTHFGHANIIRFCDRPFFSVGEMNEALIKNWNDTVKPDDQVFHLGDFAFRRSGISEKEIIEWRRRLNGKISLVLGNHDKPFAAALRKAEFEEVFPYPIIIEKYLILSHEPIEIITETSVFGNIYGHVHNDERYRTITTHSACACVERWDYRPVPLLHLLSRMAGAEQMI